MPRRQLKRDEELTPFARLLWDWMLRQNPRLTSAAELAERAGLHRQTVWQWLQRGTMPHPDSLPPLAQATGIPLDELYEAAGLEHNEGVTDRDPWQKLIFSVQRNQQLPVEARSELIERINEVRRSYATTPEDLDNAYSRLEHEIHSHDMDSETAALSSPR